MSGNSRAITTNQSGVHEALMRTVKARQAQPFRKPIAPFNAHAFDKATGWLSHHAGPWILDSGCGVGESTRWLARQFPQHLVIGVDRSASRLQRDYDDTPDNARFLRADLVDFWRLAADAHWRPEYHYLLYPNPYPKKKHLAQRWHAHPVFPYVLALGGTLECRSNWPVYLEEMATVLQYHATSTSTEPVIGEESVTPFERKYRASGQQCWRLLARLQNHHEQVVST